MGCRGCSCSSRSHAATPAATTTVAATAAACLPVPKLRKSLQNAPECPWFDWIANGTKKFEGRLWKDDWAALSVGDVIVFVSPEMRELTCRVVGLPRFESFGAAFNALGSALVPVPGVSTADVVNMYGQYYKDEDVLQYGVVAVELERMSCA